MISRFTRLSIILAGYEDDMNEKLFTFNEGIKSRFDMVHFEDFNEKELKTIWEGEVFFKLFFGTQSWFNTLTRYFKIIVIIYGSGSNQINN